jgi:hypothetical protein
MIIENKLITILGEIAILINNISTPYKVVELKSKCKHFQVDKRYKIICDLSGESDFVQAECKIKTNIKLDDSSGPDNGEDLALISLYWDKYNLGIGTLGDIPSIDYEFTSNSIIVLGEYPYKQIVFYVAWLKINNMEDGINVWLAADSSYDSLI